MAIKLMVTDDAYLLATGLALVYADDNWHEFAKTMGMDKSEDAYEMHAELQHFIATFIHDNPVILSVLITEWGEKKTTEYINKLLDHKHENGENNG